MLALVFNTNNSSRTRNKSIYAVCVVCFVVGPHVCQCNTCQFVIKMRHRLVFMRFVNTYWTKIPGPSAYGKWVFCFHVVDIWGRFFFKIRLFPNGRLRNCCPRWASTLLWRHVDGINRVGSGDCRFHFWRPFIICPFLR